MDRPAGLVTVSFPPGVTDAPAASKEIVAAVEKLVNGKFKVQDVEWTGERDKKAREAVQICITVSSSATQLSKRLTTYAQNIRYVATVCHGTLLFV